eukprot:TRINITY_DN4005_c0_g1_i5.p1 TRINITY_DN4005_c0_g1~~TRINITY_DN4005_c0_g1_i5.p1  ORF type:complete len:1114 (+),score=261.18 TRINITY_DN4005_c0_g1_i5:484-3825(+)
MLKCVSNPHDVGVVSVEMTSNGQDWTQLSTEFAYYYQPDVSSIHPSTGPVTGSTLVTVTGTNFTSSLNPSSGLYCKFGTVAPVRATIRTAKQLICLSPAAAAVGGVAVDIANNNADFTLSAVQFTYQAVAVVTSLSVSHGPQNGGTVLTVTGANFVTSSFAHCRFNHTAVAATVNTASVLVCISPVSAIGTVTVEISNNNADYTTDGTMFAYDENIVPVSLFPISGVLSGNTVVNVTGVAYLANATCQFGSIPALSRTIMSSTLLMCTSPAQSSVGEVSVEISNNGADWTGYALRYAYVDTTHVTALMPTSGPVSGSTLVTVTGSTFLSTVTMYCQFGSSLSSVATYVTASRLLCLSPQHGIAMVAVEVSVNNVHFTADAISFTYQANANVSHIALAKGPEYGKTNVTVTGTNFVNTVLSRCKFGTVVAVASYLSSSQLLCYSPAHMVGVVAVEISNNNQDYTTNGALFEYEVAIQLTSVVPSNAPASGGSTLTISGANFVASSSLLCRIDSSIGAATYSTATQVLCMTSAHAAGAVSVEVANNGQDFTFWNLELMILPDAQVQLVVPNTGPAVGGTVVSVTGMYFYRSALLMCKFGTSTAGAATFQTATSLQCLAPSHSAGTVALELSNNNQDFTSNAVSFTYHADASVTSLNVTRGFIAGGTAIAVYGTDFVSSSRLYCSVNTVRVSATYQSSTQVICVTPAVTSAGPVNVDVTNNNADFTGAPVVFTYFVTSVVTSLLPSFGSAAGGTIVTVSGTDFVDADMQCRFGTALSTPVLAFVSATRLICQTPPASAPGAIPLEVSINDQTFSTSLVHFTYIQSALVQYILPVAGPDWGNTTVTVYGATYYRSIHLMCRFGTKLAVASAITSTEIVCVAAAASAGTVALEITNNNQDFTTNGVLFTYQVVAQVTSLSPWLGAVYGGTLIAVTGTNFAQQSGTQLTCQFTSSEETVISIGTFVTASRVYCTSPAAAVGLSVLEIANNGVDFSRSGATFEYKPMWSVTELRPPFNPGTGLVTVLGTDFVQPPSAPAAWIACKFNMTLSTEHNALSGNREFDLNAAEIVTASLISASEVRCYSPSRIGNFAYVEVTMNGEDYSYDNRMLTYYDAPSVN